MKASSRFSLILFLMLISSLMFAQVIVAQEQITVTADTPVSVELTSSDSAVLIQYEALEAQAIVIQAMSDLAHPHLQILKDGVEIAKYRPANPTVASITLPAYLSAGTYTIRVSALNDFSTNARVLVGVMGQSEVSPQTLSYGGSAQGTIFSDSPVVLYQFQGVFEQSHVIANFSPVGANLRIFKLETDETWLQINSQAIGGRLYLPETEGQFQIALVSDVTQPINYTLCYISIFSSCDGTTTTEPIAEATTVSSDSCTATPIQAGGANIRSSASTQASIIGALAGGQSVPVIGIDPTGTWYQVVFNNQTGWASLAAVSGVGNCVGLPPVTPPAFPTNTAPAPEATIEPTVEATATPTPTEVMSGATPTPTSTLGLVFPVTAVFVTFTPINCTVTFGADEYIYTTTNSDISNLLHQVTAGTTYNVTGRWNNDSSWNRLDFFDGWWHNTAGTSGVLSGNCNAVPLVNAP